MERGVEYVLINESRTSNGALIMDVSSPTINSAIKASIKAISICLLTTSLSGCSSMHNGSSVTGSGNVKEETRQTGAYTGIKVNVPASIIIEVGKDGDTIITSDDNVLPQITSKVDNGVLTISSTGSINNLSKLSIKCKSAKLDSLDLNGATDTAVNGINGAKFSLSSNGASTIALQGTSDELSANMNGAGSLNAKDLITKASNVSINGAGSAIVNASEDLDASVKGAGTVSYAGKPKNVKQNVLGAGSISEI